MMGDATDAARVARPEHFFRAVEHGLSLMLAGMKPSLLLCLSRGAAARGESVSSEEVARLLRRGATLDLPPGSVIATDSVAMVKGPDGWMSTAGQVAENEQEIVDAVVSGLAKVLRVGTGKHRP